MSRTSVASLWVGAAFAVSAGPAFAHIAVSSGPATAGATQVISLGIGHGCEGSDTLRVRVEVPPAVVSVRPLNSEFGPAVLELSDAGLVAAVIWEKPEADLLSADTHYSELKLRIRVPDAPFTKLLFPTYQSCRTEDGTELESEWTAIAEGEHESESGPGPAPALTILPKQHPGWNKFTVPSEIDDLEAFFAEAVIVWKDDAAYSANPTTAELIANTPDVSELTGLDAGDEIWVRY